MFAHKLSGNWKQLETELFLLRECCTSFFSPCNEIVIIDYLHKTKDEIRSRKKCLGRRLFGMNRCLRFFLFCLALCFHEHACNCSLTVYEVYHHRHLHFEFLFSPFCRRESSDRIVLRHASHAQGSTNHAWLESRLLLFFNPNLWCNASSLNDDFVIKWGSRSCVENFSLHRWRNFFSLVMMHFTIEDE